MTSTYKLVNPYIIGDTKKTIKAKNSYIAAKQLYENLSEHFNNSVPVFNITIMKGKNKFYSFKIKEKRLGKEVGYTVEPIKVKNGKMKYKSLQEHISKLKKKVLGGAKKKSKRKYKKTSKRRRQRDSSDNDDSDIDDSDKMDFFEDDIMDSDNFYKRSTDYVPTFGSPLDYFYYSPFIYDLDKDDIYIPTFYGYAHPYVHLWYPFK